MSTVCFDTKGKPFMYQEGTMTCLVCCPFAITAKGFSEKNRTTDDKICFIAASTITGGIVGAGIGACCAGAPALPGFGIGCAVGFTAAVIKVVIDEFC